VRLRRQVPERVPGQVGDALVMPLELVDRSVRRSYAEQVAWSAERRRWLRGHGIDPGDWSAVYPVLLASWAFHAIPSALERARLNAAKGRRADRA
jgi:hypothetical protein